MVPYCTYENFQKCLPSISFLLVRNNKLYTLFLKKITRKAMLMGSYVNIKCQSHGSLILTSATKLFALYTNYKIDE